MAQILNHESSILTKALETGIVKAVAVAVAVCTTETLLHKVEV